MSVIDWESKPEPWRSTGLRFLKDLEDICGTSQIVSARIEFPVGIETPGQRLRFLRERRGWSQRQVAQKLMVATTTVSGAEVQMRGLSARTKAALAETFGVDVRDIWPII